MKYLYSTAALFAATVSADLCAHGSTDVGGNYYCQKVNAITYTGVGGSGSYNKITSMDSASGACSSSPFGYSGTLAPLDEPVSFHFRGPLKLKQFAAYLPAASSKSSKARRTAHERRHGHAHGGHAHAHLHKHRDAAPADEKRGLGDMVYAEINGVMQSWKNDYSGGAATTSATVPAAAAATSATISAPVASASTSTSSSDDNETPTSGTGWTRQGYYNAENGTSSGITFLNHEGGSGSGCFDYSFGNSLSYASADGKSGSASPQTLEDCQLGSGTEVVIMTDKPCSTGNCGFVRPGAVAYEGFDGPSKAFFMEFQMPLTGEQAASIYDPVDMPAIWMLNAQIPHTLQYGNAECSCWTTGCGEFDIFEVLAPGDLRCKSTLHGNINGGDSDYFGRPVDSTIKAAVLLYKDNIHIKILDNSAVFGKTMGDTFISEMIADTMAEGLENMVSLFKLSS